jgi:Rad3-related DNA helicase
MAIMKCPYCGREYSQRACKPLIPAHSFVSNNPRVMTAAVLNSGASEEEIRCPGSGQVPRNAESDRRPLWKDEQPR